MPDLHPHLKPLAWLLGTWRGRGEGNYPSIDPFEYLEVVVFGHVGKPFITYAQKTSDASTGQPVHAESGYIRVDEEGGLELLLSQPSGIVELHEGTVADQVIEFRSTAVYGTTSAKSVTDVYRTIRVDGHTLKYDLSMAAVGEPLQYHVAASLERVPPPV